MRQSMTRLRKIGLVSLAILIISVIVSQVAFADYVDASKNNDKLPKQYDYSLFKTGGYSVVDGYEDKAKQAADIQWRECLQQINYARNGAGWMGWGGWIYVDDEAHICRTYQASRNIALPFQTGYDISNIEPTHVMRALLAGNKFLKHTGSAYKYDEKQMKEAEKDLAGGALLLSSRPLWAGAQREETLSDDVASVMRTSVNNVNPARLVFTNPRDGERWLRDMSAQLSRFVPDEPSRRRLLINIQYETTRAGLDTQLILGLIEVESAFRQYAISNVGAKGLMQVMPFWQRYIGKPDHNLFDIRTNLRYGCTILRHYLNVENGNIVRALARFNGSLGSNKYPNAVIGAWRNRWQWN